MPGRCYARQLSLLAKLADFGHQLVPVPPKPDRPVVHVDQRRRLVLAYLVDLDRVIAEPGHHGGSPFRRPAAGRVYDDPVLLPEPGDGFGRPVNRWVRDDGFPAPARAIQVQHSVEVEADGP